MKNTIIAFGLALSLFAASAFAENSSNSRKEGREIQLPQPIPEYKPGRGANSNREYGSLVPAPTPGQNIRSLPPVINGRPVDSTQTGGAVFGN